LPTRSQRNIWGTIRQGASVLGIVSLSVIATLALQHFSVPAPAAAQTGQAQAINAGAFNVVDTNGTVRAALGLGEAGGANLTLFDSAGRAPLVILRAGNAQVGTGLSVGEAGGQRAAHIDLGITSTESPRLVLTQEGITGTFCPNGVDVPNSPGAC